MGQKENRLNNGYVGDTFPTKIWVIMLTTRMMREEGRGDDDEKIGG